MLLVPFSGHHWERLYDFYSPLAPIRYLCILTIFSWTFTSTGWTVQTVSAFPSMTDVPIPKSSLWPFSGLAPVCPCLSCSVESRTGLRSPDVSHQCWTEGKGLRPSAWWQHSSECSPGNHWHTFMQGPIAGSFSTWTPRYFFLQIYFPDSHSQCVLLHEVIPPQVQRFALPFAELCKTPVNLLLQPVEVLLNGSATIWYIGHSCQFCIVCKLAEGECCPIIQVIIQNIKCLMYTTSDWPPAGLCMSDHNPLSMTVQSVFS